MATSIYIQDITKGKLDVLADFEHRTLDGQIHFLCEKRLIELGVHTFDAAAPSESVIIPQTPNGSQAQNNEAK